MTGDGKFSDIGLPESTVSGREISTVIKSTLAEDLAGCGLSRADVAIRLTQIAGRVITVAMLDAFTAATKEGYRFPAELIAPWVRVTGSRKLLDLLAEWAGFHVADDEQNHFAALGRAQVESERAEEKLKALKEKLWLRAR